MSGSAHSHIGEFTVLIRLVLGGESFSLGKNLAPLFAYPLFQNYKFH